jgi:hypothetical protein
MQKRGNIQILVAVALLLIGGSFFIGGKRAQAEVNTCIFSGKVFSCQAVTWMYQEKVPEPIAPKKAVVRVPKDLNAYTAVPANAKNPNSIRIPLSLAPPILSKTKIINGRKVCADSKDRGVKSKKKHKGKIHVDEQCCLDPDEIPNPRCYYPELGR